MSNAERQNERIADLRRDKKDSSGELGKRTHAFGVAGFIRAGEQENYRIDYVRIIMNKGVFRKLIRNFMGRGEAPKNRIGGTYRHLSMKRTELTSFRSGSATIGQCDIFVGRRDGRGGRDGRGDRAGCCQPSGGRGFRGGQRKRSIEGLTGAHW